LEKFTLALNCLQSQQINRIFASTTLEEVIGDLVKNYDLGSKVQLGAGMIDCCQANGPEYGWSWPGTGGRGRSTKGRFEWALLMTLLLACPAGAADLNAAVKTSTHELRQAWQSEPATAKQPFPDVLLLPANHSAAKVCPDSVSFIMDTSALYCPSTRQVLLDQQWLAKDVLEHYGTWGIAYWIATALGQAIRSQSVAAGTVMQPAASNLQANCLAGVLLGSRAALKPSKATQQLSPAHTAYAASDADSQGSAGQRSYALLSGFGATASSCDNGAMTNLAIGKVPDPKLLDELIKDPDNRSSSSLSNAVNSQCHTPPTCPRRISDVYATHGTTKP
jgi:hypothetical protein